MKNYWSSIALAASAIAAGLPMATPAAAQTNGPQLSIELNNARDANNGCRLTYVALNGTGAVIEKTSYEIVVFDSDDRVQQFLILEFGRLPTGKTKVVEFDFANRECNDISRILVNDVSECETEAGASANLCMDSLRTSTRTSIGFGL